MNSFLIIACLISWIYTGKLSHQFTYIYVKLNPSINEFWFCHMIHDTYKKLDKRDERLKIWFLSQLFPSCYECRIIFKIFKRNCLISDCFVKSIFFFVCALATCTYTYDCYVKDYLNFHGFVDSDQWNKKQQSLTLMSQFSVMILTFCFWWYMYNFISQWKLFCRNSVCVYWCINYRLLVIVTCFVWGFFSLVDHSLKRHDAESTGRHFYFNIQLTSRNFCNKLIATISEFVFC